MNHGYLLSPMIFNVVLGAVLWYWVFVVTATEGEAGPGKEGFGRNNQLLVAYVYDNYRLLASRWLKSLQ